MTKSTSSYFASYVLRNHIPTLSANCADSLFHWERDKVCITEIESAKGTKIFIDLGHNLPRGDEEAPDADRLESIISANKESSQRPFITDDYQAEIIRLISSYAKNDSPYYHLNDQTTYIYSSSNSKMNYMDIE